MNQRSEVLDNTPSGLGKQQVPSQPEREPCKHYQAGHCRRGKMCKFDHTAQNCMEYNPYLESKCINEKCVKRHPRICPFFILKTCHFGSKCSLVHCEDTALYDKLSQRLQNLENKLSDPPPSKSCSEDLVMRMSDIEMRSKCFSTSIDNFCKDLLELSNNVQRNTLSTGHVKELEAENEFIHEKLIYLSECIEDKTEYLSTADKNVLCKMSRIEEDISVLKKTMIGVVKALELIQMLK